MASNKGSLIGTLIIAAVLGVAAALAVDATHDWSRERIAANERARLVARLNSVLDPAVRGRDVTTTRLDIADAQLLGSAAPVDVFVIAEHGVLVATVFASVAPHGYNAPIGLLVGVSANGVITGVRALSHRETRGLGDSIDIAKTDWIKQFDGKTLEEPSAELWAVDKDDGRFDSITGATVTSRAVTAAVKNTLLYFQQHRDELLAAARTGPADATTN